MRLMSEISLDHVHARRFYDFQWQYALHIDFM
jgi:hypothetical protein